ncbi:hypothetical protein DFS55_17205 [Mycobacterium avium subsp. hominissuis]|uniref:Uncharacterized protein n=1 Tax=Mycobacterium avium subsp. hominissuis TaxID=439334 RepID=A0A3B6XA32_MYCAV|nr:hypothetical protein DFS55_17205 [Mycobacterium avium subsp. hominissuis]
MRPFLTRPAEAHPQVLIIALATQDALPLRSHSSNLFPDCGTDTDETPSDPSSTTKDARSLSSYDQPLVAEEVNCEGTSGRRHRHLVGGNVLHLEGHWSPRRGRAVGHHRCGHIRSHNHGGKDDRIHQRKPHRVSRQQNHALLLGR